MRRELARWLTGALLLLSLVFVQACSSKAPTSEPPATPAPTYAAEQINGTSVYYVHDTIRHVGIWWTSNGIALLPDSYYLNQK